jgi:outer membrane protein assembly factor BamC
MLLPYRLLAPVALVCATLAGCSSLDFMDNKVDYRSSASNRAPSLEVPPDLSTPTYDDRYQLKGKEGATTFSAYDRERGQVRPAQTGLLPAVGGGKVKVERAGTQRWLVVYSPPEQVWNQVREFWTASGFTIAFERPDTGIIETDWAENRAKIPEDGVRKLIGKVFDFAYSTDSRDKFRTRLERGMEPNTTEVYISHRGMQEIGNGQYASGPQGFIWQSVPPNPELEAEMLRRLELRLAGPAPTQVASAEKTTATPAFGALHAHIEKGPDTVGILKVDDAFDRAWRRVGLALDRVGFTVVDRDRSKGLYFVRYADPDVKEAKDKDKSWLSKLAFWRGEDPKTQSEQYRILVTERGSTSEVKVQDKEGNADKSAAGDRILNLLLAELK